MLLDGKPKFDGLSILELEVGFTGATLVLNCKAAFVSQATGATHAWTSSKGPWSQMTIDSLRELRRSMELDLIKLHFEADSINLPGEQSQFGLPPGGIGEHLAEDDRQI